MIKEINQLDFSKTYSYADYLTWNFLERVELLKGKIFNMSPAPASDHQRISRDLGYELVHFLKGKPCEVFYAPFDVRLSTKKKDEEVLNVVQPDICIICDSKKIDKRGCLGAPDIIIEILSPGNSDKEMKNKFELYEESGVKEYWIVQPEEKVVLQYINVSGKYLNYKPLIASDTIKSDILGGLEISLQKIF